jgi:hypothetical protein
MRKTPSLLLSRAGPCIAVAALAMSVFACASVPYTPNESKVMKTVAIINSGGVADVKGLSDAPFMFDGEILLLQAEVGSLWDNLKATGFTMGKAKVASIARIGDESYRLFSPAAESRAFFKKYLNRDSVLVTLDTPEGRYFLILNREVKGYPRIQGFKGPVK